MKRAILGLFAAAAFATTLTLRAGVGTPTWMSLYLSAVATGENLLKLNCITNAERFNFYDEWENARVAILPVANGAGSVEDIRAARQELTELIQLHLKVDAKPDCGVELAKAAIRNWKPISPDSLKKSDSKPGSLSEQPSKPSEKPAKSPAGAGSVVADAKSPSSAASATLCHQSPCGCAKMKPARVCPAGSGCACTKG